MTTQTLPIFEIEHLRHAYDALAVPLLYGPAAAVPATVVVTGPVTDVEGVVRQVRAALSPRA